MGCALVAAPAGAAAQDADPLGRMLRSRDGVCIATGEERDPVTGAMVPIPNADSPRPFGFAVRTRRTENGYRQDVRYLWDASRGVFSAGANALQDGLFM